MASHDVISPITATCYSGESLGQALAEMAEHVIAREAESASHPITSDKDLFTVLAVIVDDAEATCTLIIEEYQ